MSQSVVKFNEIRRKNFCEMGYNKQIGNWIKFVLIYGKKKSYEYIVNTSQMVYRYG